jgi:primary-amine oxidase
VPGKTYEAVVSLSGSRVLSWEHVPGVQPAIVLDEFVDCEAAVRADARWQAAMRKRGVTDLSLAMVDCWSAGNFGFPEDEGRRLVRALTWVRRHAQDNGYARPVANLLTVVDLNAMQVLTVEDGGVVPLPPEDANYSPEAAGTRPGLKPVEIRQPEGPSFELAGHELRWQRWRMRIGFTPREGLVLHTVSYEDQGRERPILYRASVADMVVPYGDPRPTYFHRNAFDVGEYGIGTLANALQNGCDCLGEIRYLDAVVNDGRGRAVTLPNAICLHEEDAGILWKHVDWRLGTTEVRRSRRLVVSSISTVGNYEYGFYWYFHLDGTIQLEVKLTGVISNGAEPPGAKPRLGEMVAPGVYGPIHQHFFNARLDMMVDGPDNSVYEVNTVADGPGPENPHRNAFHAEATLLASEARRSDRSARRRFWKVVNPRCGTASAAGRLQADAGRERAAVRGPGGGRDQARRLHDPAPLGHAPRSARALCRRRVPEPASRRRRPAELRAGRRAAREHRRRGLVHLRCPPRRSRRGLAGDAGGHDRLHAQARRLLRPQPGAGRAAPDAARALLRGGLAAADHVAGLFPTPSASKV